MKCKNFISIIVWNCILFLYWMFCKKFINSIFIHISISFHFCYKLSTIIKFWLIFLSKNLWNSCKFTSISNIQILKKINVLFIQFYIVFYMKRRTKNIFLSCQFRAAGDFSIYQKTQPHQKKKCSTIISIAILFMSRAFLFFPALHFKSHWRS